MRVLIVFIACCTIQCAGTASNSPGSEFRASDAALFDDAVDLVDAPLMIEGTRGTFERRVARADLIAVVRVESLSSDLVRRRSAYRLAVRIEDRLKGGSARELVLRVEDDEPGYHTVQVNEDRLLRDSFIAFVKWETDAGSSEPVSHWHLSPASDAARDQVQIFLRKPVPDA
ncbi:MAG: hypothetical protein WAU39_08825 [Polyangiales bacterium]